MVFPNLGWGNISNPFKLPAVAKPEDLFQRRQFDQLLGLPRLSAMNKFDLKSQKLVANITTTATAITTVAPQPKDLWRALMV